MASIIRLLVGVPIAAVITFLLFMLMQRLILTDEVELEPARDELAISISEEVEDLSVRQREVTMDDVNEVEPPPPPPQIERQVAEAPAEDMNTIAGEIPEFDAPDLGSGDVSFDVSDRDAQPMVRIPPQYPPRAAERGVEGSCLMQFDVTPDGTPTNIVALDCTSSLFERSSIRAVERWRYEPRIENGNAVWRRGVQTSLDYQLAD
ncbi:MAG: energy transducer TonB [Oceanicaulis sp.]|jgi:protein TonB|uniref:energy transducer TonB n=1 Tax=Oceanicaulis TaxID=153232 RepID=UPI0003B4BD73|nr:MULTISPECIES: energy transducer TonB [Oceanicaulis]MAP48149.1 energy transducer TonB [Oceanicaulis sp.]MBL4537224.1 energy transducer TonB [Oceanicaulis sp.]HCR66597.1 energy transducer TonB [Oceanicaulis sp.]|tara:strand:+ start:1593 stop:2210 length:618 start_codon:yes stop_codon:yes gene_type:complete